MEISTRYLQEKDWQHPDRYRTGQVSLAPHSCQAEIDTIAPYLRALAQVLKVTPGPMISKKLYGAQFQDFGSLGANPCRQHGVCFEIVTVGGDHLFQLGLPMADELFMKTVLEHVDHDTDCG